MCKEEFASLQRRYLESDKTLKEFLVEIGVGYSTYNYWRKKFHAPEEAHELVLKTEDIHPPKTGISVHFSDSLA